MKMLSRVFGTAAALGCVFCTLLASAQQPVAQPQDYLANSITFPLQNPPQQVPAGAVSVQLLDNPGPATYCYWIVSNNLIGNSAPAGPFCVTNGPNTLLSGNRVSWSAPTGALTFDLLATSTTTPPSGTCGCAVATAISGITQTDTGSRGAYTVTTFNPASVRFSIDNENGAGSGVSLLEWKVNGVTVATLDSTGKLTPNSIGALSSLQLAGATSGTATLQAAAVAGGTHTLPNNTGTIAELNLAQTWTANQNFSSGTVIQWNNDTGISRIGPGQIAVGNGTAADSSGIVYATTFRGLNLFRYGTNAMLPNTGVFEWTSSGNGEGGAQDTGMSRDGAGVVDVGNGTQGDKSGTLKLASIQALTGAVTPNAAGGTDIGSTALPFANYWLGNSATNNAQITGTFTAARLYTVPNVANDTFAMLAATQTFTNKTLNGASSGNAVTLLNIQQNNGAAAITGNAADQNLCSGYTLPANTLGSGKGLRLRMFFNHNSGTATVTYKLKFGATTFDSPADANTTSDFREYTIWNNAGVQNAQVYTKFGMNGNTTFTNGFGSGTIDFTQSQAFSWTFNVAATDQVTPGPCSLELVQ